MPALSTGATSILSCSLENDPLYAFDAPSQNYETSLVLEAAQVSVPLPPVEVLSLESILERFIREGGRKHVFPTTCIGLKKRATIWGVTIQGLGEYCEQCSVKKKCSKQEEIKKQLDMT